MVRRLSVVALCAFVAGPVSFVPTAAAAPAYLFAKVDFDGTLIHGSGALSVTHIGFGRFEVTFNTDVSGCAYVATTIDISSQALLVFTAGGHFSNAGVYVETKTQAGGLSDAPFDLVVVCGGDGTSFAVIGAQKARIVRSTPGVILTNRNGGRYLVTFPTSVAACAYLATVGHPRNGAVSAPAGVYTGSGPDARTVYVETKNVGGGLTDGVPFHLAVVCPGPSSVRTAVVNAAGVLVRGSAGTTATRSSTGNYAITTDRDVLLCAWLGTRGSVDTAVPFDPATVEVEPDSGGFTVGFQVRQLQFFGGNVEDQAFHAAILC
jgi:hypothetical protein